MYRGAVLSAQCGSSTTVVTSPYRRCALPYSGAAGKDHSDDYLAYLGADIGTSLLSSLSSALSSAGPLPPAAPELR